MRRPFKYPIALILFILFFKYALRLPYRQTEGFVRTLFRETGISIELPNFRTNHYRHNQEELHFDHLPDNPKDLLQGFVIVPDSTVFFSSLKPWFGEYVNSVKFENIQKRLMFKVVTKSMFLSDSIEMFELCGWVVSRGCECLWDILNLLLDKTLLPCIVFKLCKTYPCFALLNLHRECSLLHKAQTERRLGV